MEAAATKGKESGIPEYLLTTVDVAMVGACEGIALGSTCCSHSLMVEWGEERLEV